jgi:protein-L-isoaspartate O-methyltransferase
MTTAIQNPDTPYVFGKDQLTAPTLLAALGQMCDPFTMRRLTEAGVRPGSRWLEVGAGDGSIAGWLAEMVGPGGMVIATDIRPQHIPHHRDLVVVEHNIVTDPPPNGPFDGIHVRALLQHLPERDEVLAGLAAALAPGGVLVVEELEASWSTAVLATPDPRAHRIFARYEAALTALLQAGGNDPRWPRRVHTAMRELGLTGVDTQGWQGSWAGGTGAAMLAHATGTGMRERLLSVGMSSTDLNTLQSLTLNPDLVLRGVLLLSTFGRAA